MARPGKVQSDSLVLVAEDFIRWLLSQFLNHSRTMMAIPGKDNQRDVWIMGANHRVKVETLQLIKDAAYELLIGPCEILPSTAHRVAYSVKFNDRHGEAQEVFVPMASKYLSIQNALKIADRGKA